MRRTKRGGKKCTPDDDSMMTNMTGCRQHGRALDPVRGTAPKRHGGVRIDASRRRGPCATARVRQRATTRAPCSAFCARAGSAPRDGDLAGGVPPPAVLFDVDFWDRRDRTTKGSPRTRPVLAWAHSASEGAAAELTVRPHTAVASDRRPTRFARLPVWRHRPTDTTPSRLTRRTRLSGFASC